MKKTKLTMLLMALLVLAAAPSTVSAQSLFGYESGAASIEYSTRGGVMDARGGGSGFDLGDATPENPTSDAPLGSGVAMLVIAGAGYALLKKKEDKQ